MSDDLTDELRKLRALALVEARLRFDHEVALIERNRYMMSLHRDNGGEYYPAVLGQVIERHRTHVERVKREWLGQLARWEHKTRLDLVEQIVALGGADPTK